MAIILIFLIAKLLKATVNSRIRKITNFTMDFDDLKEMRKTGLISNEEFERIRSGLVKRFVQTPSVEPAESGEKFVEKSAPNPKLELDLKQTMENPAPAPGKTGRPSSQPIDIDDLLKKGLITQEEFQKLSEINQKKM
ncbi:SHOCT domain-containing protein [Candidatus Sumerlaeota bacterium]|nr:SHOCT domain-containing protein [Candidatus Sumerlaeota bacterium]